MLAFSSLALSYAPAFVPSLQPSRTVALTMNQPVYYDHDHEVCASPRAIARGAAQNGLRCEARSTLLIAMLHALCRRTGLPGPQVNFSHDARRLVDPIAADTARTCRSACWQTRFFFSESRPSSSVSRLAVASAVAT